MAVTVLRRINAGARLHRIHRKALDPVFFGPAGSTPLARFDAPDGSYKVLYAARALETAFGETMVRSPAIPYVLSSTVQSRVHSELVVTRTLRLYPLRSEEHTSELQSLMRISYAVFCLKKKKIQTQINYENNIGNIRNKQHNEKNDTSKL